MKRQTMMYEFDGMEILISEQHNTQHAYNDIMATIRGYDVDDILRESPAFNPEEEEMNH